MAKPQKALGTLARGATGLLRRALAGRKDPDEEFEDWFRRWDLCLANATDYPQLWHGDATGDGVKLTTDRQVWFEAACSTLVRWEIRGRLTESGRLETRQGRLDPALRLRLLGL